MSIVLDGTTGITTPAETVSGAITASTVTATGLISGSTNYTGFKNRIINGGMVIDQRNAGASVTPANGQYSVDRFWAGSSVASKYSVQQNASAVTPPVGFTKYLGATSLSAYSVVSSDALTLRQTIEGFNIADLGWGTANAQTVTLSFWVRSSLTGTFGGALNNSGYVRSYPFTYTISVANTWEQKTVTITGDTTGTWATDNTVGVIVGWSLGAGTSLSGTAGSWATATYTSATGAVSVVGTSGATFYITGVQLEKGSLATSFDYRPYGTELSLCQRYYEKSYDIDTVPGSATGIGVRYSSGASGSGATTSYIVDSVNFKVSKRATNNTTVFYDAAGNSNKCVRELIGSTTTPNSVVTLVGSSQTGISMWSSTGVAATSVSYHWTSSSEL